MLNMQQNVSEKQARLRKKLSKQGSQYNSIEILEEIKKAARKKRKNKW